MKLTKEKLFKMSACEEGMTWYSANGSDTVEQTVEQIMADNRFDYANWLLCNIISHDNKIKYAIFCAKLVLENYEKKYPDNLAPRKAIEAAENYLKDKTEFNKIAADSAASAADSAASAAYRAADRAIKTKIIDYGLTLLEQ